MYLTPSDTALLLERGKQLDVPNPYLLFHKYVGEWQYEDKGGTTKLTIGSRTRDILKNIAAYSDQDGSFKFDVSNQLLQSYCQRTKAQLENFKRNGREVTQLELYTDWRLAVGLGAKGPLEIGLTLHSLYGFPYIPASSLKGMARACALLSLQEEIDINLPYIENYIEKSECSELINCLSDEKKREELLKMLTYKKKEESGEEKTHHPSFEDLKRIENNKNSIEEIRMVFGNQNQAGKVIFFDGFPSTFPKLEVDVINPHYQEYYSKGKTPGDWMQPVPSFFLAVAKGQQFEFFLASRDNKLSEKAKLWILQGLTEMGIGGKTSAGYGYFVEKEANNDSHLSSRDALREQLARSGVRTSKLK